MSRRPLFPVWASTRAARQRAEAVALVAALLAAGAVTAHVAPSAAAPPPPTAGAYDDTFGVGGTVELPRPQDGTVALDGLPAGPAVAGYDEATGQDQLLTVVRSASPRAYAALLARTDPDGRALGAEPLPDERGFEVAEGFDAVARDSADRLYVGGSITFTDPGGSTRVPAVRRYQADGRTLDPTWGGSGQVSLSSVEVEGTVASLVVDGLDRLWVGVDDEAPSATWTVARFLPDGELDPAFDGGVTTFAVPAPSGEPLQRLAVDPARDEVYAAGTVGDGQGRTDLLLARLGESGGLDTDGFGPEVAGGPGRTGTVVYGLPGGSPRSETLADLEVQQGAPVMAFSALGGAFAVRHDRDGALDAGFGADGGFTRVAYDGTSSQALGLDVDDAGRLLLSGQVLRSSEGGGTPALARLERDGRLDPSFGFSGTLSLECPGTGGLVGAQSWRGRVLATGWCGPSAILVRLLEESPLSRLQVGITVEGDGQESPAPEPARDVSVSAVAIGPDPGFQADADAVPTAALEQALADLQASPLRYSPLRYSPLRYSPLRYSPLRYSPLRYSPLRYSPLDDAPAKDLPVVTLADVPLLLRPEPPQQTGTPEEVDWAAVLAGTPYADMPLQTVLVSDVLQLLADDDLDDGARRRIEALELDQLDLSGTGWGDLSLGAYLLGGVPLADLPVPDAGSWCAYVAAHPQDVPAGDQVDCADRRLTLPELEVAGVDLEPYYGEAHSLVGTPVGDTPLGAIHLVDLDLPSTRLGSTAVADLAVPADFCSGGCGGTLAQARRDGELVRTATVSALLDPARGLRAPAEGVASLGDLLLAVVEQQGIPFEALDLDPLLDELDRGVGSRLRYAGTVEVDCGVEDLVLELPVPDGAELLDDPGERAVLRLGDDGEYKFPREHRFVHDRDADVLRVRVAGPACFGPTRDTGSFTAVLQRPRSTLEDAREAVATGGGARLTAPLSVRLVDPYDARPEREAPVPALAADQLTVGFLGEPGLTDEYRLAVRPGEVVDLTLSNLPADYDLLVYAERDEPRDPEAGAYGVPNAPLRTSPLRYSPLRYSPLRYSPVDDAEPRGGARGSSPTGPETLVGVPTDPDRPLQAFSANRGRDVDAVRVRVLDDGTQALRVVVAGFDGAHAAEPYVLHTEVDSAGLLPPCLGGPRLEPATVPAGDPASADADTRSLVLVHRQRLAQLYGQSEADQLWEALQDLAAHETVQGVVVDVGLDPDVREAYQRWDGAADDTEAACSPARANAVVTAINDLVDRNRGAAPELRFLTLVGGDTALPMGRVPDLTEVANQRDYAPATRIGGLDNPVSRAFGSGYLLSDDPYGALAPSPFLSTQLYVPDLATGRLVETPGEITETVRDYLAADGVRDVAGSFIASYDFLTDLGEELVAAARRIPGAGSTVRSRNDERWDRAAAREGLLDAAGGFASVNAHYDNNRALPADQNALGKEEELLSAREDLPGDLGSGVLATVGCNAGVNLADLLLEQDLVTARYAALPDEDRASKREKDQDRVSDWSQEVSAAGGVLIAGTGFGYGDAAAIAYSERLLLAFAQNLDGSMTLGQALQFAKQAQLETAGFGVYDHKALQEATFYGLPQWRVGPSGGVAATVLPAEPSAAPRSEVTVVLEPDLQPRRSPRGDHWTDGDALPQVTAFRPLQPRTTALVQPETPGAVPKGALLTALTTRETPIDPVVSVPVVDSTDKQPEPSAAGTFFPSVLQSVITRTTPEGLRDALVLVPGQYRAGAGGAERGVQRLVLRATAQVQYGDAADTTAPTVPRVEVADGRLQVETTDAERVVVLVLRGSGSDARDWQLLELAGDAAAARLAAPGSQTWSSDLPGGEDVELYVQAVDAAGNVTVHSDKGRTGGDEAPVPTDPPTRPGPGGPAPAPATPTPTPTPSASPTPTPTPSGSDAPTTTGPSPTASPSASPSASPQVPTAAVVGSGTITVGSQVVVTGTARPGSFLRVRAYSRPGTEYRTVRWLTVPPSGRWRVTLLPRTNTRLHATADGLESTSSVVLVGTRVAMTARPLGDRTVFFSGRVVPYRAGTLVSLYRRTPTGGVLTAQAVTDRTGWWGVERRFLEAGRFGFEVRTNGSLVSATGRSVPLGVTVR